MHIHLELFTVTQLLSSSHCLQTACTVDQNTVITGTVKIFLFAPQVDKLVEHSTTQAIRQWRRLPPVISQQHIPLLQVGVLVFPVLMVSSVLSASISKCYFNNVFPILLLVVIHLFVYFVDCFNVIFRRHNKSWNSRKRLRFIRDFILRMLDDPPVCTTWKLLWKHGGKKLLYSINFVIK